MIKKLGLYFHSLKHLKSTQINYRLFYFIRARFRRVTKFNYQYDFDRKGRSITLLPFPFFNQSFIESNTFKFLNKQKSFRTIDWDFADFGKLWTYNLNYFDFLNQPDFKVEEGKILIEKYVKELPSLQNGNEPYCISLRIINWIKFLSKNKISQASIDGSLYAQSNILIDQLEYHIMGNHLLENGFGLFFAAYYFNDERLNTIAEKIVKEQLEEQIMEDGGHYELSPMYHQIILLRVLDCYNLNINNRSFDSDISLFLLEKAKKMLSWISIMTFKNGGIPLFNDAANNITPSTEKLLKYSKQLSISFNSIDLKDSGYRKWSWDNTEVIMDVGEIGPSYIPGHAHSDMFNFELYHDNCPIIVDTGISTYDICKRRIEERSTEAHNTVKVAGVNQSEVWASFRVARKAKIKSLHEDEKTITATHTGYNHVNSSAKRTFVKNENDIEIIDEIGNSSLESVAYLHFHPDESLFKIDGEKINLRNITIVFENSEEISLKDYKFAPEFNQLIDGKMLEVKFKNILKTRIHF